MSVETTRVRTSTAADTALPSVQGVYQSRLATAAEAAAGIENGSTIAMGLSPHAPEAPPMRTILSLTVLSFWT